MFIYSIKGNTLKFVGIICLAAVLMVSLLILVPKNDTAAEAKSVSAENTLNFDKIRSNSDRVKFLEQFGWKVERSPEKETVVRIPKNFDEIMTSYNELQKKVGLDLEKYAGKEAVRYTYKVTNYPEYEGEVFANIIICKNAVIAGDVCSADVDGFIRDLTFPGGIPKEEETTAAEESDPQAPADSSSDTTAESEPAVTE